MFSKMVDSLVDKLKNANYKSSGSYVRDLTVLSGFNKEELAAARQAISEWLQDNHNDLAVENEKLKQKLFICNEIISKSNFAPMIAQPVREESE
ncbi:MAG: hypothetical protein CMP19_05100 [Rickettsiales bacterium]|nr:hypothetical protein [Rickettsiales bacterium]